MQEVNPKAVSIRQAVIMTGLGRTTLYDMIKHGELRSFKLGRRRLFLVEAIEELLKRGS